MPSAASLLLAVLVAALAAAAAAEEPQVTEVYDSSEIRNMKLKDGLNYFRVVGWLWDLRQYKLDIVTSRTDDFVEPPTLYFNWNKELPTLEKYQQSVAIDSEGTNDNGDATYHASVHNDDKDPDEADSLTFAINIPAAGATLYSLNFHWDYYKKVEGYCTDRAYEISLPASDDDGVNGRLFAATWPIDPDCEALKLQIVRAPPGGHIGCYVTAGMIPGPDFDPDSPEWQSRSETRYYVGKLETSSSKSFDSLVISNPVSRPFGGSGDYYLTFYSAVPGEATGGHFKALYDMEDGENNC